MPELAELPQPARERIAAIGGADVVIGIVAPGEPERFNTVVADIQRSAPDLYPQLRTVVVHQSDTAARETAPDTPADALLDGAARLLPFPLFRSDTTMDGVERINAAYQSLFSVSRNLGARVTAVIVSDLETVTPQWISRLIRPALDLEFDLVAPCYDHSRFEGLLNSSIVSPVTRALYGKRMQHPLGPDFGFSGRLVNRLLLNAGATQASRSRSLASIAVDAVCDGFEVCEANVGARRYPTTDWMNQSSVLARILGPLFNEAEHRASFWQRIRGSESIPLFGEETKFTDGAAEADGIDTGRMIESFQLGCRNLQEIWGVVLPPGALLELTKLSRLAPAEFRMPDALWARLIYDFALGYRLRAINQDHLLRAMTPLYLAWVASYALEVGNTPPDARLEQWSLAFEAAKPYALSRWRWPDRFNP
jgi:hypothetical protein